MYYYRKPILIIMSILNVCLSIPVHDADSDVSTKSKIEFAELDEVDKPENLLSIPWIDTRDDSWHDVIPLFKLNSEIKETSVTGWLAVTNDEIRIRINVLDDEHYNIHNANGLYNGDSLLLGIDAFGDGVGNQPIDTPLLGQDDIFILMALLNDGTAAFAINSRNSDGFQLHSDYANITRYDEINKTTYDIRLPWSEIQAAAGISSFIGVALQLNDVDTSSNSIERLQWGGGSSGTPRPGLFNKLSILQPVSDFASAVVTKKVIWRNGEYAEAVVACKSSKPLTIRASLCNEQEEITIEGSNKIRRLAIKAFPEEFSEENADFNVEILDKDQKLMTIIKEPIDSPGIEINNLHSTIEKLLAHTKNPLFIRHLYSVDALVQTEWNKAMLTIDSSPQHAYDTIKYTKRIIDGLRTNSLSQLLAIL